jgi:hypothetical protein
MSALDVVLAAGEAVIWMGAYSELLGLPVAWLRLRNTPAWKDRPSELRGIDLLAEFILLPTGATIVWGWLALLGAAAGGFGLSWGAFLLVTMGAPLIFVPWAVFQLDRSRFPGLVEAARRRREIKLAKRG